MQTNKIMRNILPPEWDDFFTTISKLCNWGRWFDDGDNKTCAYTPERKQVAANKLVQAAPRRQQGKDRYHYSAEKREMLDNIFGREDWEVNFIFITTGLWQGVWVYDAKDLYARGLLELNDDDNERNGNPYYLIPLHECHKICDLWNIFHFCSQRELYQIMRSQYEYLMKYHKVENYTDWHDVPDWCLWKYFSPWSRTLRIETEDEFRAYVKHARELPSYIEAEVDKTKLPKYED